MMSRLKNEKKFIKQFGKKAAGLKIKKGGISENEEVFAAVLEVRHLLRLQQLVNCFEL